MLIGRHLLPRSKLLAVDDLLNPHELRIALGKDHNLASSSCPWCAGGVRQLISAASGLRQEVSGCDGHAQVGVLVDRGFPTLDGDIVVRLVPEEEVIRDGHGKDCASPREGARTADKRDLVLGDHRAGAGLAVAPFLMSPKENTYLVVLNLQIPNTMTS